MEIDLTFQRRGVEVQRRASKAARGTVARQTAVSGNRLFPISVECSQSCMHQNNQYKQYKQCNQHKQYKQYKQYKQHNHYKQYKQYNSLFLLPLDCRERCAWFIQNLPSALTPAVKSNSSLSASLVQCLTCSKSVQKCQRSTISR